MSGETKAGYPGADFAILLSNAGLREDLRLSDVLKGARFREGCL